MEKQELLHSRLFNFILLLLFAFLFFGGLYLARLFLIPISFAALFAMLLLPVSRKLEKWGFKRGIAIVCSMFLLILTVSIVIFTLSTQISGFAKDLPAIRENVTEKINKVQGFIHDQTGVAPDRQHIIVRDRFSNFMDASGTYAQRIFVGTTGALATIGIILIYIFFFMYYRTRFTNFILKIGPQGQDEKTKDVINQISHVTQNYLTGVLMVILLLAIMNTTGLLIIGLKHAIFFGVLAAILNIIPYIGVFIGGLLPTLYAFVAYDSFGVVIATAAIFVATQFIENNFLTPMIVGSKVQINPLATIIALLIGGSLWGVGGMILFIPFLGVAKIIFDNVETLQPYGYLIGEDDEDTGPSYWEKLKNKAFNHHKKQ